MFFLLFCYPKSMPTMQIIFLRFIYIIYLIFIVQKRTMIIKSYKFICRLFFLDSFLNSFIKSFQGDIYQFYAIVHFLAKKAVEYFFMCRLWMCVDFGHKTKINIMSSGWICGSNRICWVVMIVAANCNARAYRWY